MNNKINKINKKAQMEILIKWVLPIIGLLVIVVFLFYSAIPGVVTIMAKFGLIDIEIPDPPKLEKIQPTSEEGKTVVEALNSIKKSIDDCAAKKGKTGCVCDMDVPMYDATHTISFWNYNDKTGFVAYAYKGDSETTDLPTTAILESHEFRDMFLCTSQDLLINKNPGPNHEERFNLYRDGTTLMYHKIPAKALSRDEFFILGSKEQNENDNTKNINFKLYRIDNNNICFIINRQDDAWTEMTGGYGDSNTENIRKIISGLDTC